MSDSDPLVLRPGRRKWVLILIACLAFVGCGALIFFVAPGGRGGGVVTMAFFGLGAAVSIFQLASNSHLKLSRTGFTVAALRRLSTTRWSEVSSFYAVDAGPTALNRMVAVNLVREERLDGVPGAVKAAFGYNRLLPDTYGMKAEKLAALMNDWRSRYAAPDGSAEGT